MSRDEASIDTPLAASLDTVGRKIRELGSQAVIYGMGTTLTRMIGFMLIPVYTRFLTPADYGQLELITVTTAIMTILAAQGMTTSFFRFYPEAKEDQNTSLLVSTTYLYLIGSAVLLAGVLFLSSEALGRFLFPESALGETYVRMLAIIIPMNMIVLTPYQLFRARLQAVRTVKVSLFGFIVQILITIYLVVVVRLGVMGILIGQAASALALVTLTFLLIRRDVVWR